METKTSLFLEDTPYLYASSCIGIFVYEMLQQANGKELIRVIAFLFFLEMTQIRRVSIPVLPLILWSSAEIVTRRIFGLFEQNQSREKNSFAYF